MEDEILRVHEVNLWNLKFRHSKKFQFRNRKEYTRYTNQLILNFEPYVYRRYEDEYNRERLLVKMSWTVMVFFVSFILLLIAFLFLYNPLVSYLIFTLSTLSFVSGVLLKRNYRKFAFNIDAARQLITDELIERVKQDLKKYK